MSLSVTIHGSGYPVVVLPGLGLDAAFTAAVTEPALPLSDHRRIYVSLPGCGSPTLSEASSDAIVEALSDWVRTDLGSQPFALLGYSYGGHLAAGLTRRLTSQVQGLLLVCSGVRLDPTRRDLSGVLPPDVEPGWLDPCPEDLHEHLASAVGRQHRDVGARLGAAWAEAAAADDDFLTELRERYELSDEPDLMPLEQPVTFVTGRRDGIVGFRDQFLAAQACPNATYVLLPEAGHYLPAETPEAFAATAAIWLATQQSK